MDTESDIREDLTSLQDEPADETENTPISFNNASLSFHTHPTDLPSTSRLKSPSDFIVPALDHVDRTRVDYVPLTRTQRDFSKETPSIETSPRLTSTSRTGLYSPSLSTSRMMKANTVNLSSVSNGSVSSLSLSTLSNIVKQRKAGQISAGTSTGGEKSCFQDLGAPIYERTQRWRTSSASRLSFIKTQNLEKEIAECSFAPALSPKAQLFSPTENVELRTQKWKEAADRKTQQQKVKSEEEVASNCTFRPAVLQTDNTKMTFDGKKFYARNVEWQRRALNKAKNTHEPVKAPPPPPPAKVVKRAPSAQSRLVTAEEGVKEMTELEEFKMHASSLGRILKGTALGLPISAPASGTRVRLKSEATGRKEIRQELLLAKIALLETKVTAALKASPQSS